MKIEMKEKYGNYFRWAVTIILIIIAGLLAFFIMFRFDSIVALFQKITSSLFSVLLGAVIAYLVNPVFVFLNKRLYALAQRCHIPMRAARTTAKALSIILSLGLLISLVAALLALVIPEFYRSLTKLAGDFRNYVNNIYAFINQHLENNPELLSYAETALAKVTAYVTDWLDNELLVQAQTIMSGVTVGIIGTAKTLVNIVISLIISVYLLSSKDRFLGQAKKLLYTFAKPDSANVLLSICRQVDRIFGGFISGKLLDSLIIGVLCFIGMTVLRMPYVALVSVIIGVTNIIPFFGPFIGAIPSAFLILLVSPKYCLIFIIFILILQQLDGNIIGPKILGDSTGLSPFWVVVAISLGSGLFGFLGMLLGVPTFAVFYFLLKTFVEYRLKNKDLPTASLSYSRIEKIDPETGKPVFLPKETPKRRSKKNDRSGHHDVMNAISTAAANFKTRGFRNSAAADRQTDDETASGLDDRR